MTVFTPTVPYSRGISLTIGLIISPVLSTVQVNAISVRKGIFLILRSLFTSGSVALHRMQNTP